jgi:hypothetical protein
VQNWRVVRAVDRQTKLLPVETDEERDHDHIRQDDSNYCNHLDIPVSPASPSVRTFVVLTYRTPPPFNLIPFSMTVTAHPDRSVSASKR